ncbi:MAG: ATP-grasp domain-containing protein [Acidobacteriia bacterium]|nr:ATP-grasp domain-containing protein [Terriglobia bacterium]
MREINILITAASRRVPLIQGFVQALRRLGVRGNVVTSDMNALSPALYFSDRHYLVPLTTDKQYLPLIRSICFKERIHLLIPTIDDELPLFGAHAGSFLEMGVRVAVSGQETGTICNDKLRTVQFLAEKGIATPRTWLPHELDFGSLSYPLFLKPRQGRGSVGAHPINNEKELRFFSSYVADPVIQEYLPGREFTIDVLADFNGAIISAVPRERLVVRSGVTDRGQTWNHPALIDLGVRVAEALQIRGPANIQLKWYADRGTVFEVNPRFSGGINLTIAAGADFPAWLIEMRLGRRVRPALGKFTDSLLMTCYETALFLSSNVAAVGGMKQADAQVPPAGRGRTARSNVVAQGPWMEA